MYQSFTALGISLLKIGQKNKITPVSGLFYFFSELSLRNRLSNWTI
jgi:hypothetical protein